MAPHVHSLLLLALVCSAFVYERVVKAEAVTLPHWATDNDKDASNDYSSSDKCACADFNTGNTCYCSRERKPQPEPRGEPQTRIYKFDDDNDDDQCECTGKIRKFKTIYFGSDKATIKFYDYDKQEYIRVHCSFENVKYGQEINCRMGKKKTFSSRTLFRITHIDGSVCSGYFETNCNEIPEIGEYDDECGELLLSGWADNESHKCDDGFKPCKCVNKKPVPKQGPIFTPQDQDKTQPVGNRRVIDPFDAMWNDAVEEDKQDKSAAQGEVLFHDNSDYGGDSDGKLDDSRKHLYIFGGAFVINIFVVLYCLFGSQTCGIVQKKDIIVDDQHNASNSSSCSDDWDGSIEFESDGVNVTDTETD